eukprot:6593892-Prymnesium_polylepis.1
MARGEELAIGRAHCAERRGRARQRRGTPGGSPPRRRLGRAATDKLTPSGGWAPTCSQSGWRR